MHRCETSLVLLETDGPTHVSPVCIAREIQYVNVAPLPSVSGPFCAHKPLLPTDVAGVVGQELDPGLSELRRYTAARAPASAASSAALVLVSCVERMFVLIAIELATPTSTIEISRTASAITIAMPVSSRSRSNARVISVLIA